MKLVTIQAESAASALKKAQSEYGESAIVVTTKEIRKKSLMSPALYEVVIAVEDDAVAKKNNNLEKPLKEAQTEKKETSQIKQPKPNPYLKNMEDVSLEFSKTVQQISKIADISEPLSEQKKEKQVEPLIQKNTNQTQLQKTIESGMQDIKQIKAEINRLNDRISLIQHTLWEEKGPKKDGLLIPQEFAEIYAIVKNNGMLKEHIDKIMQLTLELMPPKMKDNSVLIKRYFREILKKMILSRRELELSGTKRIMMFVGPTGVGKTTTLAKLAARYAYMLDKRYKVGIITLDTYRTGAMEQLMFYAKTMKLSIDRVEDPPEFITAINSLRYCDCILIDTAGSSQYDKAKIDSLRSYLNAETNATIEVTLVVAANTKYEDLKEIYNAFSCLKIETIVVTKLDETKAFGNIFSLLYETQKPVSYFSIGQEVPDDLIVASGEFLTSCLLNGFNKELIEGK